MVARFTHFSCIDWSGAKGSRHRGIAVATCAEGTAAPCLVSPPNRFWSRTEIANWIAAQSDNMLIGFDFSFAPPFVARDGYLSGEHVPRSAKAFWSFVEHCCEDDDIGAASFIEERFRKHFYLGKSDGTKSDFMHLRACEAHFNADGGGKPSSIFDAIGAAQVCKSSFAGMRLLNALVDRVPIWPFDPISDAGPVIVEIYTTIAARAAGLRKGLSKIRDASALDRSLAAVGSGAHQPMDIYSDHATDAILTSAWMRGVAHDPSLWSPPPLTKRVAMTEGWTFGVI